jgi:hypothetical protein
VQPGGLAITARPRDANGTIGLVAPLVGDGPGSGRRRPPVCEHCYAPVDLAKDLGG